MSDGMTDESRRDRQAAKRWKIPSKEYGPVMGGLIVDPTQKRISKLEKQIDTLETSIYKLLSRLDTRISVLEGENK
jgi:hypothetical protein